MTKRGGWEIVIGVLDDGGISGREGEREWAWKGRRRGGDKSVTTGVGLSVAPESGRYAIRSGLASALHLPY